MRPLARPPITLVSQHRCRTARMFQASPSAVAFSESKTRPPRHSVVGFVIFFEGKRFSPSLWANSMPNATFPRTRNRQSGSSGAGFAASSSTYQSPRGAVPEHCFTQLRSQPLASHLTFPFVAKPRRLSPCCRSRQPRWHHPLHRFSHDGFA